MIVLDLRAYSLLLDEERKQLLADLTPTCDILKEPTHRLDDFMDKHIKVMITRRSNIAYAAEKIKHFKELSNTMSEGYR